MKVLHVVSALHKAGGGTSTLAAVALSNRAIQTYGCFSPQTARKTGSAHHRTAVRPQTVIWTKRLMVVYRVHRRLSSEKPPVAKTGLPCYNKEALPAGAETSSKEREQA